MGLVDSHCDDTQFKSIKSKVAPPLNIHPCMPSAAIPSSADVSLAPSSPLNPRSIGMGAEKLSGSPHEEVILETYDSADEDKHALGG